MSKKPRIVLLHGTPGAMEPIQRAFASGKPAIVDVMIDLNTLAPVVYRPQ